MGVSVMRETSSPSVGVIGLLPPLAISLSDSMTNEKVSQLWSYLLYPLDCFRLGCKSRGENSIPLAEFAGERENSREE